ncbi:MAG: hypothetical protein V4577_10175 [Bacteroidota bacterium]
MIRTKHDIDTQLVNFFISENKFDHEINEALINWFSSLEDKNHQNSRAGAIEFLKRLSRVVLTEIDYPLNERECLIRIFDPLELLLRTALSIRQVGEDEHFVRDHLSHTVRNVLFTNYLLNKYHPDNYSSLRMKLFITAIFHDLAYPIEKIKKVAGKLGGATFTDLLNSKGDVEITLNNPDDLLEMLNYFNRIIKYLENKLDSDIDDLSKESTSVTLLKIKHIYREIISKAIAGKGLFDASHSLSSVVLFLRPIVKFWSDSNSYQDINLENIADICLAMAYHDRSNHVQEIKDFEIPLILKIMRIADELQEWDREMDSFINDAKIENDVSTVLTYKLIMRNKNKASKWECKAEYFIPDKISGLLPVVTNNESINLKIHFPTVVDINELKIRLKKIDEELEKGINKMKYLVQFEEPGKIVNINFHHNTATIQIS